MKLYIIRRQDGVTTLSTAKTDTEAIFIAGEGGSFQYIGETHLNDILLAIVLNTSSTVQ